MKILKWHEILYVGKKSPVPYYNEKVVFTFFDDVGAASISLRMALMEALL